MDLTSFSMISALENFSLKAVVQTLFLIVFRVHSCFCHGAFVQVRFYDATYKLNLWFGSIEMHINVKIFRTNRCILKSFAQLTFPISDEHYFLGDPKFATASFCPCSFVRLGDSTCQHPKV